MNKSYSFSWILMWSIAYITVAVLKPEIIYDVPIVFSFTFLMGMGLCMLFGLIFNLKFLLFATGLAESIGGVASWVGIIVWRVPWISGYDPLVQISMSILDLISAVFLFQYSIDYVEKHFLHKNVLK